MWIRNAIQNRDWIGLLVGFGARLLALLFVIPMHEVAHGWMAMKLGDPTARQRGRLTLNPFAHLNWLGALMMIFVGFGWAEPVPVNPLYFRNRKRDMALTALAGPASNILMAFIGMLVYVLTYVPPLSSIANTVVGEPVRLFLYYWIVLNISLAVFNLIPVAPLDGSRIVAAVLPDSFLFRIARYERMIHLVLLAVLFSGRLDTVLSAVNNAVFRGMLQVVLLPFKAFGLF